MEQRKTAKAKTTTRYILIVRTGVDTRVDIREEECQTSSKSTVCEWYHMLWNLLYQWALNIIMLQLDYCQEDEDKDYSLAGLKQANPQT